MIKKVILILSLIVLNLGIVWAEQYCPEDWWACYEVTPLEDIWTVERNAQCDTNWNCLDKTSFMIDTKDISPWTKNYNETWDIKDTANNILSTIIQNLMVAIWVIALLVMSIWAWYMIFYHGQDEMLSKGKTMFTTWITALIIALISYYLVSLLRYILYTWN